MTVQDAIVQINHLKPSRYDETTIVEWLSDLDGYIYSEIIEGHEGDHKPPLPYDANQGLEQVLLVPEPYSDIYIKYLSAQIDYANADFGRYNNSMVMYNMALSAFADWYNRTHMPKQKSYIKV